MNQKELTVRSLFIGVLGSLIITTSSMYVALKLGALPWPTIFVAVLSMALLKAMGNTNLREINVAHTGMSAGAMVAGGLAFTMPAVWILGKGDEISFIAIGAVALGGTCVGLISTIILRKVFIIEKEYPFPMGIAASETVKSGDSGGKKAIWLAGSMLFTVIFTILKDIYAIIPARLLKVFSKYNIPVGVEISPMILSIGFIIGPLYTGMWFIGAVVGNYIITPILNILNENSIFDPDSMFGKAFANPASFVSTLAIGIMIGSGLGIVLKALYNFVISGLKVNISDDKHQKTGGVITSQQNGILHMKWMIPIILFVAVLFIMGTPMGILSSIFTIAGAIFATFMSASMTGQTGINPMEIFGIIILLLVRTLVTLFGAGFGKESEAIFVVAAVAVACGLAGDILNDYKSGRLLGTSPRSQFISEAVGGVVGAIVSTIVLYVIVKAYGGAFGEGTDFIAPQAVMVSNMVSGISNMPAFISGIILGTVLYLLNIPSMTIGIGMYLPITYGTAVFIGGMLKFFLKKFTPKKEDIQLVTASGVLGGEGITGVGIAILRLFQIL